MQKKNILFINGISDDRKVKVSNILKDGRMNYTLSGTANIFNYLENDLFNRSVVTFDTNPKNNIELNNIHAVFNQISEADSHKITLSKVENLYKSVSGKIPFFNLPSNIRKTTRNNIYQLLQGIDKLHVPKTVRLQPKSQSDIYNVIKKEEFKYPVIFRQAGDHGGISTILIKDKTEQFHTFSLDGRDYYLTQFVDCAEDGIYAKYRLVVVDGEVFLADAMFSKNWMVHERTQYEEKNLEEDSAKHFLKETKPTIKPIITEIHHRLGLDYFGIDCSFDKDMNLLVFEINANMNVFWDHEEEVGIFGDIFKDHLKMTHQALIDMLSSKTKYHRDYLAKWLYN